MTIDQMARSRHNGCVGRGFLLALCLCALWGTATRTMPAAAHTTTDATDVCLAAGHSSGTGDSDSRWAASPTITPSHSESGWKSSVVHAQLASAPCAHVVVETGRARSPDRLSQHTATHLRHLPLLI
jgi:hypothetical protein